MAVDLILGGNGEVGRALTEVLTDHPENIVAIIDLEATPSDNLLAHARYLHVAIGYGPDFETTVETWRSRCPNLTATVVHSTVPVGTSETNGWYYSPVTGRHPNLTESLRTFTKPVAGPHVATLTTLVRDLRAVGIPALAHPDTRSLEGSKLADLALFGGHVVLQKAIYDWCERNDLDFELVYTYAGRKYNEGYAMLGHREYTRPLLRHQPGPLGGHCVVPGIGHMDDKFFTELIEYGNSLGNDERQ